MLNFSINIRVIPHESQRYETVGDWWWNGEELNIRVSSLDDWKKESLIAIHEATEALLCKSNGVDGRKVDEFDKMFETERKNHEHSCEAEPGDDPRAPYFHEHQLATSIEYQLSRGLGVNWKEYEDSINAL